MTVFIVVAVLDVILLALVVPLRVRVNFRFSLDRQKCFLTVHVVGINILRIKIENKNGSIGILLNGKQLKNRGDKGKTVIRLPKILNLVRAEKIVKEVICLGIIGGADAGAAGYNYGALASACCALLPEADTSFVFPDFKSERCDFEIKINSRISALQAAKFAFL